MKKPTAALLFLAVNSTAVLAYSGPQSHFVEFDCSIIEKCDHQFLCKKTEERTQIAFTSLVHDLSVSMLKGPIGHPFNTWQEATAWVEFLNPRAGKLPLPIWYPDDSGFGREVTFRLEDWLNGQQESPYDVKGFAFVMTGDLEEINHSRANLDTDDDLPWQITVYKKLWGETGKYSTLKLLCDSGQ